MRFNFKVYWLFCSRKYSRLHHLINIQLLKIYWPFVQQMKLVVLISVIVNFCCSLSLIPQFTISQRYIQTGTYSLSTSQYYGNTSLLAVNQTTFVIPFLQAKSTSFIADISLQDLDFQVTPSREISIAIQKSPSISNDSLTVILYSQKLNYLQILKARSIVLQKQSNRILFMSGKRTSFSISNAVSNSLNVFSGISGISGTNACIWMNGFQLIAPNSTIRLDLKISAKYLIGGSIKITISTTIIETLAIDYVYYVIAAFNQGNIEAWPFPGTRITLATLAGSGSTSAVYTDSADVMKSFNTFWGLTRFNVNNQPSIRFSSSLSGATLQAGSALPFNNIDLAALIFEFKECDSTTPYYMIATNTCYDICPSRFYEDQASLKTCQPCTLYSCFKCESNGLCSQCSAIFDYRTLNPSTSQCDPLQSYYDDGLSNPTALPCSNTCKTCLITADNCTSCNSGFSLNQNNQCQQQIIKVLQSNSNPIIILIPVLLVTICILIMIWVFCRRRNRQNKVHCNKTISQINEFTLSHFPEVNDDKKAVDKNVDNPTSSNSKVFTISDIKVSEQNEGNHRYGKKGSINSTMLNFI